jgi:putative spermidine/putrescine transport system substrate-binding protein
MSCTPTPPVQNTVRVVSWGGQFQTDLMAHWVTPAAEDADLTLEAESWDGDYGALTTRIERARNNWDVVHVEANYVMTPRFQQLFQSFPGRELGTLSPSIRDDEILSDLIQSGRAAPVLEYAYVVAGRSDRLNGRSAATVSWQDFWDVRALPGRRGMRDFPVGNIEAALASMGHDPRTYLYEERDAARVRQIVNEALARIGAIQPQIVWWSSGDELQQQLETGDVALAAAWSGRVRAAFRTLCPGVTDVNACKVAANPRTALISTDWWIIPNGAPHPENGDRLMRALFAQAQVSGAREFAERQGYAAPVVGADARDPVASHFLHLGSSGNEQRLARISEVFWGQHFDEIYQMWNDWRAGSQ